MKPENSQILKQSPIFAALDQSEFDELFSLVKEKRLVQNETVFWEGDASDWFYLIAEGKVKVTKLASTGKEVILSFFGQGEIFGEVAVFENKPYPASATAVTDVRLMGIQKSDFIRFLLHHPEVALKIISILSGRLRESQNRLRDLAGERVEQRLARMLLMLSERLGSTLPFTRQELSDMSGTTTETTIRIMSQWKDLGVINSVRGKILIADEAKLKALAEGPSEG